MATTPFMSVISSKGIISYELGLRGFLTFIAPSIVIFSSVTITSDSSVSAARIIGEADKYS